MQSLSHPLDQTVAAAAAAAALPCTLSDNDTTNQAHYTALHYIVEMGIEPNTELEQFGVYGQRATMACFFYRRARVLFPNKVHTFGEMQLKSPGRVL